MAVRQYVGARYVPKFYQNSQNPLSSEWEGNKAYEALTIVTYNNSSYTSKIPVPAGIGNPAQNPTYWVVTGNYNAQVEQYRQETETTKTDLTEQMNILKSETEQSVQQLQNSVDKKQSKRSFLLIGDSLSSGYSPSETSEPRTHGWAYKAKIDLEQAGATVYNYTDLPSTETVGTGFAEGGWERFLQSIHNNSTINDNNITDIVVFGGSNELSYDETTIRTHIDNFMKMANQYFPLAHVRLGIVAVCAERLSDKGIPSIYRSEITKCGGEYVEGTYYLMRLKDSNYVNSDRTHPTNAGYDYFYPMILRFIISSSAKFEYVAYGNTPFSSSPSSILFEVYPNYKCTQDGIFFKPGSKGNANPVLSYSSPITLTSSGAVNVSVKTGSPVVLNSPSNTIYPVKQAFMSGHYTMVLNLTNTEWDNETYNIYGVFYEASGSPASTYSGYLLTATDWYKLC